MTRLFCCSFILFALVVAIAGCRSGELDVQSVTGTVTYNGSPLEGAIVTFVSAEDDSGYGATAVTEMDGRYSLNTHGANRNGALVGTYNVTISKTIAIDRNGKEYLDDSQPLGPSGRPDTKHLIPEKYSGMSTTAILSANVKKGKNVFDFNLED